MSDLDALRARHAIPGVVQFHPAPGGLVRIQVVNQSASASILLQGAHVLDYRPGGSPQGLIWVSEEARIGPGRSVRGGVPLCWPWFGAHPSQPKFPGHGHARTTPWRLLRVSAVSPSCTELEFTIEESEQSRRFWSHPTEVRYRLRIGQALEASLTTGNLGREPVTIGAALHTYFSVGDVRRCTVDGLDGCAYLDKVAGMARKTQHGAVTIDGEVDRIYLDTPARSAIVDPVLGRRIRIEASGSASTVVWNPGPAKAAAMGDLGPDGYLRMLCVETANAADDTVTLAPGERHTMSARYSLDPL